MSGRAQRIARNTGFNIVSGIASAGTLFVASVIIARSLGPKETGIYALVAWTIFAVSTLGANGLGLSITKFTAQYDDAAEGGTSSAVIRFGLRAGFVLALVLALILAATSEPLARALGEPRAGGLLVLAAVVAVPASLVRLARFPLQGLERQAILLPLALVQGVLTLAGTAAVLAFGGGLVELLLVQLVVGLLVLGLSLAALRQAIVPSRARLGPLRSRVTSYGLAVLGMAALDLIVWQRSEVIFLGILRSPAEVAYYSIAFAMAEALQQTVPTALSTALFPSLSRAFELADRAFLARAYEQSVRILLAVTLPVAVAGAILAGPIVRVIYGEDFAEAAFALQVLLFSAGAARVAMSFSSLLYAGDRERLILALTCGWAALNLALSLALIAPLGVPGAAIANAATQLLAVSVGPFVTRRAFGLAFPVRAALRACAAAVPLALALAATSLVSSSDVVTLVLGLLVAGPAYAVGLVLTGAIEPAERAAVVARLRGRRPKAPTAAGTDPEG
jgi:O-antigen/teichoic acid export membrane protein